MLFPACWMASTLHFQSTLQPKVSPSKAALFQFSGWSQWEQWDMISPSSFKSCLNSKLGVVIKFNLQRLTVCTVSELSLDSSSPVAPITKLSENPSSPVPIPADPEWGCSATCLSPSAGRDCVSSLALCSSAHTTVLELTAELVSSGTYFFPLSFLMLFWSPLVPPPSHGRCKLSKELEWLGAICAVVDKLTAVLMESRLHERTRNKVLSAKIDQQPFKTSPLLPNTIMG